MTTAVSDTRAKDLLAVPVDQRDVDWLRRSLQVAAELELFTLPPYLCGFWSCVERFEDVAQVIRRVAMNEMGHLGQALNLLTAVGGMPTVNTRPPVYPGPLPGGLIPGTTVHLAGLTKGYIAGVFMEIERPQAGPFTAPPTEPSIGTFYDAIGATLRRLNPTPAVDRQHFSFVGADIVTTVDEALAAIAAMKDSGEGTSSRPDVAEALLAHYYRFAEVVAGGKLVDVDGCLQFGGSRLPFPETFPMAAVPAGGWPHPSAAVADLLGQVDDGFTSLLDNLQRAWETGDGDFLSAAVDDMGIFEGPARELMAIPLPGGGGTYGPQFRYRHRAD